MTTGDGVLWFWDHETDDRVRLADSVSEIATHRVDAPPVALHQVS